MAKKTTFRPSDEPNSDAAPASSAAPSRPRGRKTATQTPQSDGPAALADDRASAVDDGRFPTPAPSSDAEPRSGSPDEESTSVSMSSEPSEDDIRIRAYHRYLERGGGHGQHFEDWLEAERELKTK